ncbi:hypothetical protein CIB95_08925 [Lottiidibacillus patelloidae]|uniref:Helicase ATP-binding domain-containing protein n=1 Tax=Lottiidibacillus patelloidae TaxID=2670334 RepID=A0A263BT39_9BACI|nr:hypothetical protein [Lottiidibacillus patelloidae]OZM56883.1 hypothetical protein CIB95_08925 [Lottiidibacillus patelloidae]
MFNEKCSLNNLKDFKVKVSLDVSGLEAKPQGESEIIRINNRIAKYPKEIKVCELAEKIITPSARSFCPAVFTNGSRKNANWQSQQIFALDIDEGLKVSEALQRCERYNINPIIVYATFRHTERHQKFRLLFLLNEELTDIRARDYVQKSLMYLFPEADSNTSDASRLLFGGKEILFYDYKNYISVPSINEAITIKLKNSSNSTRNTRNYCAMVGINIINGVPDIKIINDNEEIEDNENTFVSMKKSRARPINNNRSCSQIIHDYSYIINFSHNVNLIRESNEQIGKFNIESFKTNRANKVRNFPFKQLHSKCRLYREALSGEHWLYHREMFGIMNNLLHIRGGEAKVKQILTSRPEYKSKISDWNIMSNQIIKAQYAPSRCSNFCPFANECEHGTNLIDQGKLCRGSVKRFKRHESKKLEESELELKRIFTNATTSDDLITIIKAPTGIGKTDLYINAAKDTPMTIALPTHRLKEEVSARLEQQNIFHCKVPNLHDFELSPVIEQQVNQLYNVGAYKSVQKILEENKHNDNSIYTYLNELEHFNNEKSNVKLTTHQRCLYTNVEKERLLIIDEDIIPNVLPISSVSFEDIIKSITKILCISNEENLNEIEEFRNALYELHENVVYDLPRNNFRRIFNNIDKDIISELNLNSDIVGLFDCKHFIKVKNNGSNYNLVFIKKNTLPKNKIIILSATINETIAKMVFGNKIKFYDLGSVEQQGEIIQIPIKSYSRFQLTNNNNLSLEAINLREKYNPNSKVITYKGFFNDLQNSDNVNFGNTEGIDTLRGENLTIIGTPHINSLCYRLISSALGFNSDNDEMTYHKISRNGFEFYFNTYKNNETLKEIQLYFIESGLLQAIGRARTLRESAKVLVLSNYPIKEAKLLNLSYQKLIRINNECLE